MQINITERYNFLTKYVNDRRSQEESIKDSKDPMIQLVFNGRKTGTSLIDFWKENVTRRRMEFRKKMGFE